MTGKEYIQKIAILRSYYGTPFTDVEQCKLETEFNESSKKDQLRMMGAVDSSLAIQKISFK